jgi:hypothetical protein
MKQPLALGVLITLLACGPLAAASVETRVSDVFPAGYATNGINSLSLTRNNLVSVGDWQFAAFYGALACEPRPCRAPILIARRSRQGGGWTTRATPFSIEDAFSNTGVRDDHNVVAMGVDAKGFLHVTWGMHNAPLAYAVTREPVTGRAFGDAAGLAFGYRQAMTGEAESAVTYPEFFHLAGSRDLFFTYRMGGAGGGSGNGDQYINRYDARAGRWRRVASPMVDGVSSSMNAYLNTFAQDRSGALIASWTIRESPDWQTNHDLYAARSRDQGATWFSIDGKRLGPPITRETADTLAKVLALPTRSSLINQTSTAVDAAGRPMIATWWAPRAAAGDHTRQYMLYWRGARGAWTASQVSDRAWGEAYDSKADHVRELGRPVVLVDKAGRVLVVTRASDSGKPVTDASNKLVVYWSKDRKTWDKVVLSDVNLGTWEPSYDRALWERENRLSLFFQPVGLGQASSPVQVLDWDAAAYFARLR